LFEKHYDALGYPEAGLTNELNGTCQLGQLLLQGYEQEIQNGRILREAYAYEINSYDHDEKMRLIDLSGYTYKGWDPYHLRLRSDNDQRTIMSGQVLLRGLFDEEVADEFYRTKQFPKIQVHTADRSKDILDPNEDVCPKLKKIKENALQSEEYKAWDNSQSVKELREFANRTLGYASEDGILDCLMVRIYFIYSMPPIHKRIRTRTKHPISSSESLTRQHRIVFVFIDNHLHGQNLARGDQRLWKRKYFMV